MSVPVPVTRTLTAVLQRELDAARRGLTLTVAKVSAIPDAQHVTVELEGVALTIPRLASFTPVVGKAAYCLAGENTLIAIGGVA